MTIQEEEKMSEISIVFTGDITFTKYFGSVESGTELLDDPVADFLRSADHCIGNIEGPFTSDEAFHGEFKHHSDPRFAPMIFNMGIDIWNLANNHSLDFGEKGIKDTYKCAAELGASVIGVNQEKNAIKLLIFPEAGGIGIISVTYSEKSMRKHSDMYIDWKDFESIQKAVNEVKEKNRWCVIVSHGGLEFSDMPAPNTREVYLKYIGMGADIVVGHHPHTVQNYEMVKEKTVFYSLGNFVFDTDYQRAQEHTNAGELLKIRFTEQSYSWINLPIYINRVENQIEKGDDPPVFINIDGKGYRRIWPFAAIGLSESERNIVRYLNPEKYKKFSRMMWFARDIKSIKNKEKRSIIFGKCIAYVKNLLKNKNDSVIIDYVSRM